MRIAGVATVADRQEFFRKEGYPSIKANTDRALGYYDWIENDYGDPIGKGEFGDAGKFKAFELTEDECYFYSCDDDLIYHPEYFDTLQHYIDLFQKKAVITIHGSNFKKFPISSYYDDRNGYSCRQRNPELRRVLFPGTGVTAFHSSLFTKEERRNFLENFPVPNMADIWMGILLQKKKIPALCIPHNGDLVTYNEELPIEDTIWGQHHRSDFLQTAVVNEHSRREGFRYLPLPQREK